MDPVDRSNRCTVGEILAATSAQGPIDVGRYVSGPLEIRRTRRRWTLSAGPYKIAVRPTLYKAKRYAEEMP